MPVSKKRKKKRKSGPPPPKSSSTPKPRITKQKILIYIISGLMILSLLIGFIASGSSSRSRAVQTPGPQENILVETPLPNDQSSDEATAPNSEATVEPTAED